MTLTLDPDVAALIESELKSSQSSLKDVVNDTLRRGFAAKRASRRTKKLKMPKPLRVGKLNITNLDKVGEILSLIDSDRRVVWR